MANIIIDGSGLVHKHFVLVGTKINTLQPATVRDTQGNIIANPWLYDFLPTTADISNGGDWFLNGINTFDLPDDTYTIIVQSANYSLVTFTVSSGIIYYDRSIDSIVSGRGTNTLILIGVTITIDASYIIGRGVNLGRVWDDFRAKVTGNFLPNWATHKYSFIVGSGLVADFEFNIDISGKILYDFRKYQGYVSGKGTNCLTLYGYPVLIDARQTKESSFEVIGPWDNTMVDNHNPKAESKVVMGNFMPLNWDISQLLYGLKIDASGHQTGFHIDSKGIITLNAGFHKNTFKGISRITVLS